MKIDIQLDQKYIDNLNLLLQVNRADPNTFVSEIVKSKIDEIEQVNDDVQKFQEYVQAHPRGKGLLRLYTWNLRRRLSWSEDRLENVECVIMLRRSREENDD